MKNILIDILKRFRSPVTLTSLFALIFFVLKNYGLFAPLGLTENSYQELTSLLVGVLTILGIINNPSDSQKF